jgi:hypothetical protein
VSQVCEGLLDIVEECVILFGLHHHVIYIGVHATPAVTLLIVVIQDMLAGVTSDPSQPEHPCTWAGLSSSDAEVAVILDEAILVAETRRESQSPVMLVLSEGE